MLPHAKESASMRLLVSIPIILPILFTHIQYPGSVFLKSSQGWILQHRYIHTYMYICIFTYIHKEHAYIYTYFKLLLWLNKTGAYLYPWILSQWKVCTKSFMQDRDGWVWFVGTMYIQTNMSFQIFRYRFFNFNILPFRKNKQINK